MLYGQVYLKLDFGIWLHPLIIFQNKSNHLSSFSTEFQMTLEHENEFCFLKTAITML